MNGATVPEAPVHEYGDPSFGEGDVDCAAFCVGDGVTDAISEACTM